MTDRDQLTSLKELLRDALEIARSVATATEDAATRAACERSRQNIAVTLTDLDGLVTRERQTS